MEDGEALISRGDPGRDQLLGGDPVDVEVVDDGDVARVQAFDQVLGALAEAGGSFDRGIGSCAVPPAQECGEATAASGGHPGG